MKISKTISFIVLGVTSILLSRIMLLSFNDPEGPNLLVVMVMAVIVYLLSLAAFFSFSSLTGHTLTGLKKLLLVIFIQIIIVTALYFCLR